jgi:hypothetical protein
MSLPWAHPPRTRPTALPPTPGISAACRAVPVGAARRRSLAVSSRLPLGTDTGGSVRQPASFCGLTGIKPTYGRVSRFGLVAYGSSLDSVGALATCRRCCPSALQMAGYDPRDATSMQIGLPEIDFSQGAILKACVLACRMNTSSPVSIRRLKQPSGRPSR